VSGSAPRAPGDSVRPRRLLIASARPLSFTVRLLGEPLSLTVTLAAYILQLEHCLASTNRAEDRPIYGRLLSDTAGLLAGSVMNEPLPILQSRIDTHERLWGQIWLQDELYREAYRAWEKAKNEALHLAI
jgi:hypothetical protein